MGKHPVWFWLFTAALIAAVVIVVEVPFLYDRAAVWVERAYLFLKVNAAAVFAAFFLVKGKFVLKIFLKKMLFISATGLGKRYLIERVFTYHFKKHFLDHIKGDLLKLAAYIKKNFMRFPLTKKIVAGFVFLGSLGYVGKFMGWMLAMKVFVAKLWSFLLAVVLKTGSAVVYFFTDYIWGSWLAPIIEVVIFSWLLDLLEKVPFLTSTIRRLYRGSLALIRWIEAHIGRVLHYPLRRLLRWLLAQVRRMIYAFIGYKRVSAWHQLQELRMYEPSIRERLAQKRKARKAARTKVRLSRFAKRRAERKDQ